METIKPIETRVLSEGRKLEIYHEYAYKVFEKDKSEKDKWVRSSWGYPSKDDIIDEFKNTLRRKL